MTFGGAAQWLCKDAYLRRFDRTVGLRRGGNSNEEFI
jgi:hypothetical protein